MKNLFKVLLALIVSFNSFGQNGFPVVVGTGGFPVMVTNGTAITEQNFSTDLKNSLIDLPKILKNNGWAIIGTNPCSLQSSDPASAMITLSRTTKALHIATADASQIMLMYANYAAIQGSSMNANYNSVLVGSALQKTVSGSLTDETGYLFTNNFKSGKVKTHIDAGAFSFTEPAFFDVAKNERFFTRTYSSTILPASPSAPSLATSTTGGSLVASATYNVCYTYVFQDGFESSASASAAITVGTGSTNSITVTSPTAVSGAIGYKIYMTTRNVASTVLHNMLHSNALTPFGTNAIIQYEVSNNAQRFVRPGGQPYYVNGGGLVGGTIFEGMNSGEGSIEGDHTSTGFRQSQTYSLKQYWPSVILGKVKKSVTTFSLNGDSIEAGTGDNGYAGINGGWGVRAVCDQLSVTYDLTKNPLFGYVKIALGGEKASQFANNLNGNQYNRTRLAISELATCVIDNYGRNDLADPIETIKANFLLMAKWYTARGIKYYKATILPSSTSTDGWQTTTNQTPESGTSGSNRIALNNWIRDTTATGFMKTVNAPGLVDFIDVCKYIEVNSSNALTTNGGYWRVSADAPVLTGTLTAVNSNYEFVDNTKSLTSNIYKGYNILITSGSAINKQGCLAWNNATTFNTNGVSIGATPAIGDGYKILLLPTIDGVHPASWGHTLAAQAAKEKITQ